MVIFWVLGFFILLEGFLCCGILFWFFFYDNNKIEIIFIYLNIIYEYKEVLNVFDKEIENYSYIKNIFYIDNVVYIVFK